MRCPACGGTNADHRKFCGECGVALALPPVGCPACGTVADPGSKFCGECGARLSEVAADSGHAPAPAPRTTERRVCSVLFCDLVGFTTLSEKRDQEQVRDLLSQYFGLARTIVDRYGGTIEKFIGDAVMAVWGAPTAHEDGAERAVRAGLELVDAVAAFGAEHGVPKLRARAGVVTGEVAVTLGAVGEGMVAGDAVNTAARVQSAADPGAVLVDEQTRRQTAASVEYVTAGEHELKGKQSPVPLSRAVRVVAGIGGLDRIDGLEARFIGRDRELRAIKEAFHGVADEQRARLVSIVGLAGVGKSRLHWEFEKYVDGLAETVFWHSGRCLPYGEGVAYWALAQIVRKRLGIGEEEGGASAARKLDDGLARWVRDTSARDFLRPRLGALLGVAEPGLQREDLFAGWRLWFEQLAEHHPVVLIIDDLQWADAGLLDFCEHLLDWAGDAPVFLLTLARPDLLERRPGWAAGRGSVTSLVLDPLPDQAVRAVLDDLVADLPEPVANRIVTAAGGVPLYLVELVRSLVDRDLIQAVDGSYRLVDDVGSLDVPASLSSLITARIDALPPQARELVEGLSVLGGTFPRTAVSAVTAHPAEEVDALLAALVRREILTVRTDRLSPDQGHYAFTQSIARTVAYETLSRHDRKARHLQVARHLQEVFPDEGSEMAEVVAEHFRDSYLAQPEDPDADEIREQARAAYERAGRRALSVGAPETAVRALQVAAGLVEDEATRTTLVERAGEAAEQGGRMNEAADLYGAAAVAHDAAGRIRDAAYCRMRRRGCLAAGGDVATEMLDEARSDVALLDADETIHERSVLVRLSLAGELVFSGSADEARPYCERGLEEAQALQSLRALCQGAVLKGIVLNWSNRADEALMYFRWGIELGERSSDMQDQLRALLCASDLCMTSDLPGGEEHALAAMEFARRRGDRFALRFNAGNLILMLLQKGRWDEAARLIEELVGDPEAEAWVGSEHVAVRRGLLAAWRGDLSTAQTVLERIRSWESTADQQSLSAWRTLTAVTALASEDFPRALEVGLLGVQDAVEYLGVRHESNRLLWPATMESALALGRTDDARHVLALLADRPPGHVPPYLQAEVAHYQARLDGGDDAHGLYAEAARILRELGYPLFLARVLCDWAQWLTEQARPTEAAVLADEAVAVLEPLGAAPDLARAGALRGALTAPLPPLAS